MKHIKVGIKNNNPNSFFLNLIKKNAKAFTIASGIIPRDRAKPHISQV